VTYSDICVTVDFSGVPIAPDSRLCNLMDNKLTSNPTFGFKSRSNENFISDILSY